MQKHRFRRSPTKAALHTPTPSRSCQPIVYLVNDGICHLDSFVQIGIDLDFANFQIIALLVRTNFLDWINTPCEASYFFQISSANGILAAISHDNGQFVHTGARVEFNRRDVVPTFSKLASFFSYEQFSQTQLFRANTFQASPGVTTECIGATTDIVFNWPPYWRLLKTDVDLNPSFGHFTIHERQSLPSMSTVPGSR